MAIHPLALSDARSRFHSQLSSAGTLPDMKMSYMRQWAREKEFRVECCHEYVHAGPKVAEDARVTRDDRPSLYTLSRDGALFSWAFNHGEEEPSARSKRRRIDPEVTPNASQEESSMNGRDEAGQEISLDKARNSEFSGWPSNFPFFLLPPP